MRIERLKQTVLGVLLALLVCPVQSAQAQFAVYDAANHATQLQRMAQDLQHWVETVQHYMQEIEHYNRMFDNAVQQVTTLGGIMTTVDEQLARNRRLIGTISSVGQTIRNLYQLERQIYNMVTTRIRAVQNVWMRLKDGIFDPTQNMRDLEEYMKYSIGKPSEEAVARVELLANQDAEFEQYLYLRELAYGRLANAERSVKELEAQLALEMGKPEGERQGVAELNARIADARQLVETIRGQITELTEKINEKMITYGVVLDAHVNFGRRVQQDTEAWAEMTRVNDEVLSALGEAFDPDSEQPMDVTPDDEFEIYRQP